MRYGTYVRFSLLPCSSLISLLSNKLLCFSIQLQTSESPISSTSYYASMSSSPTIYNMDFSFGSPYSGRAENSAGPATIKVSSLDDMCKSGGITVIILMVIVVGVLVLLYLLCHGFKGTKKQSSFRRYFSVLYRSIVGVASNNATSTHRSSLQQRRRESVNFSKSNNGAIRKGIREAYGPRLLGSSCVFLSPPFPWLPRSIMKTGGHIIHCWCCKGL